LVEPLTAADWHRVAQLVERYADLGLGGVDASLVAIAERIDVTEIPTLDQRDFRAVRPKTRRRLHAAAVSRVC
jgi:predicted nucleic acid-binding protein